MTCKPLSLAALAAAVILAACAAPQGSTPGLAPGGPAPTAAPQQAQPVQPAAEAGIPAPTGLTYWQAPGFPAALADQAGQALTGVGFTRAEAPEGAALSLVISPPTESALQAGWVYALAAPFPTVPDGVSWAAFQAYWLSGDAAGLAGFTGGPALVLTAADAEALIALLGPASTGLPLQIVPEDQLVDALWAARPSLTVRPFDQLEPRLKVLAIDGINPLDRAADMGAYPLRLGVGVTAQPGDPGAQGLQAINAAGFWVLSNRDAGRISNVVLTGTTAIARATAMQVKLNGPGFPAQDILPFFADADILHTSNESSYAVDCPEPDWYGEPIFCSQRSTFDVLKLAGFDIIEATGNHVNDWGTEAMTNTLNVYNNEGVSYYGGGFDLEDARTPRILTTPDGTRVAFTGCNSVGPFGAYATTATPGAAPCDDFSAFHSRIGQLKQNDEADVVIATLQYWELPAYAPSDEQIADFAAIAAAGADIVSGSQAHQPQGFGFPSGGFVHYGIGNLFFDQMDFIENRQMFADKHVLYQGRHISTILFTGLMEDWARPRPMTPEERAEFLALIFSEGSVW